MPAHDPRDARVVRFTCLAVLLLGSSAPALCAGEQYSPAVQERIAAVEQGLIPAVRVKGRTSPTTIADRMTQDRVPAVSVAVINDGKIEWAKAYGVTDVDDGRPVTVDSLFQAASISKPLTALAALKLVEQGKLDLDSDVNAKLKSWHVPENEFTKQHAVDLRGLLSHTAGLTVHGFSGYEVGEALPTVPQILDGQPPANSDPVRVNKVPGHGFRYSGGGTTIVQQLLIDVTGRPFAVVMRENVLEPLGMTRSTYEAPLPQDRADEAVSGHGDNGKPVKGRWHIYPEQGAAALWTTPSELARYLLEVQKARRGESDRVLGPELLEAMLTPQGGGPVGLGPFLLDRRGTRYFEHSGGNEGFRCDAVALCDGNQGAVVMTNANSGNRAVNELINSIALVYNWPGYLPPEREQAQVDDATLERLAGTYALNVASVATISRREGRLFVQLPRQPEIELHPASSDSFVGAEPEVSGRWEHDDRGQVAAVIFKFGDREVRAKRVP